MTRIIVTASLGLILFVAGLAGSWFFTQSGQAETASEFDDIVPSKAVDVAEQPSDPNAIVPTALHQKPLSAEEVFRYSALFRDQQDSIDQQKADLDQRKHRMMLMEEDLTRARSELDGLREQAVDVLHQAEQLLVSVTETKANIAKEREGMQSTLQEYEDSKQEIDAAEKANLKKVSSWFQSMPAATAAGYLQQLANEGKLSSAVQLLREIEERNAAKILAEISDASLVVQLTEEFRATR